MACLNGGENHRALEKNHRKLVRNRQNRVDITKHKCRDIGLPDGIGEANRQAAQGDGSTGTTLSGHCYQSGPDCPSPAYFRNAWNASQPRFSETPGIYPSPAFSEAPGTTIKTLTDHTACGESSQSLGCKFPPSPTLPHPFASHSEKTKHSNFHIK